MYSSVFVLYTHISLFALSGIRTLALMLLVLCVHSLSIVTTTPAGRTLTLNHGLLWQLFTQVSYLTKYNLAVVRVRRLVCPIRILTTNRTTNKSKQLDKITVALLAQENMSSQGICNGMWSVYDIISVLCLVHSWFTALCWDDNDRWSIQ